MIKNLPRIEQFYRQFTLLLLVFVLLGSFGCSGSKKARKKEEAILSVIAEARSYKGTPYRYGGTTRSGMDCSGLLIRSYESINFPMPRTSKEQGKVGKKVPIHKLQKGDLVFFAAKKSSRKITHVGLITEVKGRNEVYFIHASTSLGVVENNLYAEHYRKIYVKARRPL